MVKRSNKMTGLEARVENGVKIGLILSGDLIIGRAIDRVHVITERLKRSLKRGNPYRTSNGLAISMGSDVEYAFTEETREGSKHGTSHAYMRPALDESRREAIAIFGKSVVRKMVRR